MLDHANQQVVGAYDARVRQRVALASSTGCKQELTHRSSETHAYGCNITADELHGVVDSHTCSYGSTRAVDVQPDVCIGIFTFEIQQLSTDLVCNVIVHVGAQHDDPVLQQSREDVGTWVSATIKGNGADRKSRGTHIGERLPARAE